MRRHVFRVFALWALPFSLPAQLVSFSPYSGYALGDRTDYAQARNLGMGGLGIGIAGKYSVNPRNPAAYSDLLNTVFDFSGFYQHTWFQTATEKQALSTGGLQGLTMGFPFNKPIAFAAGLVPYSVVGYDIRTGYNLLEEDSTLRSITSNRRGSGGVNQVFLGLSGALFRKRLSLGLQSNYLFGTLSDIWLTDVDSSGTSWLVGYSRENRLRGLRLDAGLQYNDTIALKVRTRSLTAADSANARRLRRIKAQNFKRRNFEKLVWRVGATAGYHPSMFSHFEELEFSNTYTDTLQEISDLSVDVPLEWGLGFSLEVPFTLTAGVDFSTQNWTSLNLPGRNGNLQSSWLLRAGIEYTPNFFDPRRFWERIAYRAGASYEQVYVRVNDQGINRLAFSMGLGIPVISVKSRTDFFSRINLGLEYALRGSTENGLIREDNLRFVFGVSFSQRWFQRRVFR